MLLWATENNVAGHMVARGSLIAHPCSTPKVRNLQSYGYMQLSIKFNAAMHL